MATTEATKKTVTIPITNVYMDGDYTGQIEVGAARTKLNVILDTGSSSLAIDGQKYKVAATDKTTNLAQADSYGDGSSWTGAVITTTVTVGPDASPVALPNANVAIAYDESASMFRQADGILGLAYAPLDDAYQMPEPTWPKRYTNAQVLGGKRTTVAPYLTQLAQQGITSDIVSFYTRRSFIHMGAGGASDPLNQGAMIIGGGQDQTSYFTGAFQAVKVLADEWYNTNLLTITVGGSTINVPKRGQTGMPSNSIVDSGTNSLNLGPTLLKALLGKFTAAQQQLLTSSIEGRSVTTSDLGDLANWPAIGFTLQGATGNVQLQVAATDYWQVNAPKVGAAMVAITQGSDGLAILGLPLLNGYFTIFDGEADGGMGQILFATSKR
jgi:hypothetical protein